MKPCITELFQDKAKEGATLYRARTDSEEAIETQAEYNFPDYWNQALEVKHHRPL